MAQILALFATQIELCWVRIVGSTSRKFKFTWSRLVEPSKLGECAECGTAIVRELNAFLTLSEPLNGPILGSGLKIEYFRSDYSNIRTHDLLVDLKFQ